MDAMHRSPEGRAEVLTGRQYRMVNEHIGRIIAVGSGKGGVGKSTVTSMLALAAAKQGLKAGILDADITGPSIPKLFGLEHLPQPSGERLEPAVSTAGIRVMSINLLLDDPAKPIIWRGPMVGSVITQFYTDLDWGKLDYLFIDLPPGTSDAPLSVMQSIPVDGFVLVTSPQELSVLVVEKAAAMTQMLDVPLIGIVENMAWLQCPECGKRIDLFGGSHTGRLESSWGVPLWTTAFWTRSSDAARTPFRSCPGGPTRSRRCWKKRRRVTTTPKKQRRKRPAPARRKRRTVPEAAEAVRRQEPALTDRKRSFSRFKRITEKREPGRAPFFLFP